MTPFFTALAAALFAVGGYLLGARMGREARAALRRDLAAAAEREHEVRGLREEMAGVLRPVAERERLGLELAQLEVASTGRAGLAPLLTAIAARVGFAQVVISDENGLPLAVNDGAPGSDELAASASLVLTLADRMALDGQPPPQSVVVRDSDNRVVVHRLFRVADERYVITAVTIGSHLPSDVLDPSLARIERALASGTLA